MKLYYCNKTVLRFYPKGPEFINGYSTNDVDAPLNAFVDIQGRIVAVAHQQKVSEDEMHVIVEEAFAGRLLIHLGKFLSLSDTQAERLSAKKVYWDFETDRLTVTEETMNAEVSQEEFTLYRLRKGVSLQGVDFDQELVLCVDEDNLVSYTKGCYLGQEIVARVHYRGKPPKRLVVKTQSECSPDELGRMTSRVWDPQLGENVGFVFVSHPAPSFDGINSGGDQA